MGRERIPRPSRLPTPTYVTLQWEGLLRRGLQVVGDKCLPPPFRSAHQNHPLHHSILLHQQGRVLLQGAVQVIAQ